MIKNIPTNHTTAIAVSKLASTAKATLYNFLDYDKSCWIPKSCIISTFTPGGSDTETEATIKSWILVKNGILEEDDLDTDDSDQQFDYFVGSYFPS